MTARWISIVLAALIIAAAAGVLLFGWIANYNDVARLGPTSAEMVPSTAISFVLLGLGLLIRWSQAHLLRSPLALSLSLVVAVLAVVDLAGLSAEVGGGEGLVRDDWRHGEMSRATALQFLLASYCLAALSDNRLWFRPAFSACATGGLLLSLVAAVGHAFDADALAEVFLFSAMAPQTAVNAAFLHVALLLKRPQASWVDLLLGRGPGSVIARRLLPLAVLGPFLLCLATLALVRVGMFDVNFRLSLLTIILISVSSLAILRNADIANRAERMALRDRLTGLPNRTFFIEELNRAVARAKESGAKVGLILFDLDRFHSINQFLGDAIGDAVLRDVAARTDAETSGEDILARVGGDEFALMVSDRQTSQEINQSAEHIREILMRPAIINGGAIETSASFGVSIFPDDAPDASALRRHADLAVEVCKASGRRSICLYDEKLAEAALRRAQMESDLRRAIERDELFLEFQPLFDLASQRMNCVEALVRWRHEKYGVIPPAQFIPIAEEGGMIRPLGQWILRSACAQRAEWKRQGRDIRVAVNVSPAETAYDDYPDLLGKTLDAAGLDGSDIELEITEGLLIEHETLSVRNFLSACEEREIGLAIDDFGTGYSSLSYLRRLPVSKIKIDRSFVAGLGQTDGESLVAALVGIGRSLDKRVVAEGIEFQAQLQTLKRLGCDDAQGYLLSPPLKADAIYA